MLIVSVHASWTLRKRDKSDEPGYYCNNNRYLFTEVEKLRKTACRSFVLPSPKARRPVVHFEEIENEDMIFEWSFPAPRRVGSGGRVRPISDKIIFDNSCELKDVVYYNTRSKKFHSCEKVPEIPKSSTSETEQLPIMSSLQCGSLSFDIREIQESALRYLLNSPEKFKEVKDTSNQDDGPWNRATLIKQCPVENTVDKIKYEIITNNQNEVRGVAVTHQISRRQKVGNNSAQGVYILPTPRKTTTKHVINLVCMFDIKFPLFFGNQDHRPIIRRKRKAPAMLGSD